jgi:hypothetical protein
MHQRVIATQVTLNYFFWRRIPLLFTTGDRFETAQDVQNLYTDQSPTGQPFVILKEQPDDFVYQVQYFD